MMSYIYATIIIGDDMQINRLFEIVYMLLNKETVTAKEFSKHFEVSVRTIYRDIDTLSAAGIPIYMNKGRGGGIRLLENFVLKKSVLSDQEQSEILTALQGLSAIKYPDVNNAISKLGAIFNKKDFNWIDVDFSHWGSGDEEKFKLLKEAIINRRTIYFDYYNSWGEKSERNVEPLQFWFKDKAWYIRAYCLLKQGFRVFKFSRIKNLKLSEKTFERQFLKEWFEGTTGANRNMVDLKLQFDPFVAYRVYDEFGEEDITRNEDGSFTVNVSYPEDEWVYGYIMSFGSYAEVKEPQHIRDIIKARLEENLKKYM